MNKLAFLGLALITIGLFSLVFNSNQSVFNFFSSKTVTINESKVVDDGNKIASIDIKSSSSDVYVIPTDRDDILIELKGKVSSKLVDSFSLDVDTSKDKLNVIVNKSNKTVKNIFGVVIMNLKLEIYVPQKIYDSISIHTSSGGISIDELKAINFEISASSGRIEASNLIVEKDLNLQSSSGRIKTSNSQANNINLRASSGSITLNNSAAEKISAATSSGRIELNDSEGDVSAAASSGRITINNKQLSGDINAATSSGHVEIILDEIPSSTVDFRGSSGKGKVSISEMVFEENSKNHIYGKIGSGDYEIKVRTSSGGFNLN